MRLPRRVAFAEGTTSLYPQTTFDPVANRNVSRVSNVAHVASDGTELAHSAKFFVVDLRMQIKLNEHVTASAGIDNVNNYKYWTSTITRSEVT